MQVVYVNDSFPSSSSAFYNFWGAIGSDINFFFLVSAYDADYCRVLAAGNRPLPGHDSKVQGKRRASGYCGMYLWAYNQRGSMLFSSPFPRLPLQHLPPIDLRKARETRSIHAFLRSSLATLQPLPKTARPPAREQSEVHERTEITVPFSRVRTDSRSRAKGGLSSYEDRFLFPRDLIGRIDQTPSLHSDPNCSAPAQDASPKTVFK